MLQKLGPKLEVLNLSFTTISDQGKPVTHKPPHMQCLNICFVCFQSCKPSPSSAGS